MKLSDAIRIGSMTTKQIKSRVWDGHNGTCAAGAALSAINKLEVSSCHYDLMKYFPVSKKNVESPVKKGYFREVCGMITELNDCYDWTRDQIADWVSQIESNDTKSIVKNTYATTGFKA